MIIIDILKNLLATFIFFILISFFVITFLGIPCFLILKKLNWLNLPSIMLSAYCISLAGLLFLLQAPLPRYRDGFYMLGGYAHFFFFPAHLITLLGAFIFWLIAIQGNHQSKQ